MEISRNFTGALVVKDASSRFCIFVFESGHLGYFENFNAKNFEEAEEIANQILVDEEYEEQNVVLDVEGNFDMLIGEILENEQIVFDLSDSYEDEDDYDGSIESYLSDPNHWC